MSLRHRLAKVQLALILSSWTSCLTVAGQAGRISSADSPQQNVQVKQDQRIDGLFGFANEAGTKLLATDESTSENPGIVKTLTKAICPGSRTFNIQFLAHQSGNKKDNGRDTSYNSANRAGSVFHIVDGKVEDNGTCLLVNWNYLEGKQLLPLKTMFQEGNAASRPRCDDKTKSGLAKQRGRAPVDCWLLADIGENGRVLAVCYAPRQKSLLAALVLQIGDRQFVNQMPAVYNSISTWREGDGGKFDPATLVPLFALKDGQNGPWDIAIEWLGEEGSNLNVYRSGLDTLKPVLTGYRYLAPD
jgi:hypothetical protein